MSSKSKYPSKKVLVSAALLAALAVTGLLGATPIAAGQVANSTPIQNNTVGISTLQTSSSSSDNASDYFILQSQQELFDATKTGQAEQIFAKIVAICKFNLVSRNLSASSLVIPGIS